MLKHFPSKQIIAGCDEAGRGCLAGPVAVSYTHLTLPTTPYV